MRRIGVVALARKLLIAFWKYLEKGEVPDGAVEVELGKKVGKLWRQEVPTTVEVGGTEEEGQGQRGQTPASPNESSLLRGRRETKIGLSVRGVSYWS